jgi:hypothetical protein
VAVGWQLPGGAYERPIPGIRLSPYSGLEPIPTITSAAVTDAMADMEYAYVITAMGIPAPTLTVSGLPAWLTFDGVDTISGTPTGSDEGLTPTITLTATNSEGADTQTLSITVVPDPNEPSITITAPAAGDVWYMGTTRRITWDANNIPEVIIFCSPDGGGIGASWVQIEGASVSPTDPRWRSYPWTLGQELVVEITPSTNCVIKVCTCQQEHPALSGVFEVRAVTDVDGDGMDDGWEATYLGDMLQDGTGDADGDDLTDYDEFMRGSDSTDPNDPSPPMAAASSGSGMSCAPGVNAGAPGLFVFAALMLMARLFVARNITPAFASERDEQQ